MKNQNFQEEAKHLEGVKKLMEDKIAFEEKRLQERDLDITRQDTIQYGIQQLERQKESPYFGRIDVQFGKDEKVEKMYIGPATFFDEEDQVQVYDWRAPIASLFYEGTLGELHYETPNGAQKAQAFLKRDIVIKKGTLQSVYDIENEESLLMEALSAPTNKDGHLEGITATIQKEQNMTSQVIYKTEKQEVEMASITVKTVEDGEENFKELLMPGGEKAPLYTRYNKTGEWDKEVQEKGGKYIVYPDYFQLLNGLNELAQDLKLEETDNDYVFTLKTQDADILGVYGKEFRFNFSQFPKSNFKKELTVKIDKKSKFLKEFKMNISTSGDQGTLAIKSETSYSDWNLVKKEDIPTISDEKKEQ